MRTAALTTQPIESKEREMNRTQIVAEQDPQRAEDSVLTPEDVAFRRKCCNWLEHWRDCDVPACRRTHACAGDPTDCYIRHWLRYPDIARVWVRAGISALARERSARAAALAADFALVLHVKAMANLPRRHTRGPRR
jgi:hypothetical protein